jgi:hypothetical protein
MTGLIPAFAAMGDAAVLDGSRVAGSARAGQTQSRERHHADVSFIANSQSARDGRRPARGSVGRGGTFSSAKSKQPRVFNCLKIQPRCTHKSTRKGTPLSARLHEIRIRSRER